MASTVLWAQDPSSGPRDLPRCSPGEGGDGADPQYGVGEGKTLPLSQLGGKQKTTKNKRQFFFQPAEVNWVFYTAIGVFGEGS